MRISDWSSDVCSSDLWADVKALNIRQPAHWSIATDYVPQMIEFAKAIADRHCYELDSGLYFDTTTVSDYGRLARHSSDEGESRIDPVDGKRHPAACSTRRKPPAGDEPRHGVTGKRGA